MKILALDPATKCGWAHNCGASGVWDLSIRKDESGGMRVIRFRAKLRELLEEGVDLVVYEAPRFVGTRGGDRALRIAGQLEGVLMTFCDDHGIEYRCYSPSEIKKHATGKGNAPKPVVMAAACERWHDIPIVDDNQADALWLLDLAEQEYGKVNAA